MIETTKTTPTTKSSAKGLLVLVLLVVGVCTAAGFSSSKPRAGSSNPARLSNAATSFSGPYSSTSTATIRAPAENGSYYGQPNRNGVAKTVFVRGYYRSNGTYVRSHYRSRPYSNLRLSR